MAISERTALLIPSDSGASSQTAADAEDNSKDPDGPNQFVDQRRALVIIISVWMLIFLQAVNMSCMSTIQSTVAGDLDAFLYTNWFTSAFLISMSSVAPLAGRLSQLFSPRNCIVVSSVFFSMGTFLTSQAPSLEIFLAGRVLTGVGAAGILTISIILVLELTGKKRRGLFIGMINAGYTSGVALGAVISGALLPVTGWRPLFWAQTPIALLAGLGVFFGIPSDFVSGPRSHKKESLSRKLASVDYTGAVMLISTIVLFLYGFSSTKIQWVPIVLSLILLLLFILNEIYIAKVPIIAVSVLKSRGALLTCFAQVGFMSARWMVLLYTPVYALAVRGWSPASAGSILVPTNFGFGLGGLLAGWLHIRRAGSFYIPALVSFLLFSVTLFALAQLSTSESSSTLYIITTFLNGLCTGAALNYTLAHILHLTVPSTHFITSSLLATFRGFASSFGSAIGGGIFLRVLQSSLEKGFADHEMHDEGDLIRQLLGSPALVAHLQGTEKEVAVAGYVSAIKVVLSAGSLLAAAMVVVQGGGGWRVPCEDEEIEDGVQQRVG